MRLQRDLDELVNAGVLSEEKAHEISIYFEKKRQAQPNRLMMVFGLLGAILFGLGIISILAHNWDDFTRDTKAVISFIPVILGQLVVLYVLLKRFDQNVWRESSTVLLFFGVGASIALVAQVYNIPGNTATFVLTWLALVAPLIYVMNSSITSLLFIGLLTYYANIFEWGLDYNRILYWAFLLIPLPHYYFLLRNKANGNAVKWHHWIIPISIIFCLHTLNTSRLFDDLLVLHFMTAFGLFYQLGTNSPMKNTGQITSYKFLGSLGGIVVLLFLSFDWFWEWLMKRDWTLFNFTSSDSIGFIILFLLASILLIRKIQKSGIKNTDLRDWVFVIFFVIFLIGMYSWTSIILVNLLLLALGISIVLEGSRKNHLGILNYGLLIILALVLCRFFDEELSFILRGLLFLGTGIAFWLANYRLIKKRRSNE